MRGSQGPSRIRSARPAFGSAKPRTAPGCNSNASALERPDRARLRQRVDVRVDAADRHRQLLIADTVTL